MLVLKSIKTDYKLYRKYTQCVSILIYLYTHIHTHTQYISELFLYTLLRTRQVRWGKLLFGRDTKQWFEGSLSPKVLG